MLEIEFICIYILIFDNKMKYEHLKMYYKLA